MVGTSNSSYELVVEIASWKIHSVRIFNENEHQWEICDDKNIWDLQLKRKFCNSYNGHVGKGGGGQTHVSIGV